MRDVIGQRRLLDRLAERAAKGDVAHAYGLFGPRGVGKRTIALRLAQTLQCESGLPGGCGSCLACRKIERGVHPDVRLVTRDPDLKLISIDQIRQMREDLALRPLEGRWRVIIIDDARDLDQGQDALLKTLEEPPSHAVLLLLTTTPAFLHETILSRLQPLQLRLVPTAEIAAGLAARGIANADRYAAAAGGRPGLALTLAADERARADRARIESELYRLFASGLTARFAWALDLSDEPHPRKRVEAIDLRFGQWSELLRDAAVAARGELTTPARPDRRAETEALASDLEPKELLDTALLAQRLQDDLRDNANARALLELFVLRLPFDLQTARRLEVLGHQGERS